jgi:hypothetical protein
MCLGTSKKIKILGNFLTAIFMLLILYYLLLGNLSVEFLFFALNPARGVKCITGGETKRNRRSRNSPIFQSPARAR